jgi:hypothetical protein
MTTRLALFIAWCVLLTGIAAYMSYQGSSPFADGARGRSSYFYGPTHK